MKKRIILVVLYASLFTFGITLSYREGFKCGYNYTQKAFDVFYEEAEKDKFPIAPLMEDTTYRVFGNYYLLKNDDKSNASLLWIVPKNQPRYPAINVQNIGGKACIYITDSEGQKGNSIKIECDINKKRFNYIIYFHGKGMAVYQVHDADFIPLRKNASDKK